MKESESAAERYFESCQSEFWQKVFHLELEYLVQHLQGCRDILSVGCGPAILEGELAERGFNVTGLDVSQKALDRAPKQVRTVVSRAEDISFPGNSFDAVIFVASLQFIEGYREALEKSARVLRRGGKILVMLLNPESAYFKDRYRDPGSYVSKIRHTDLKTMEDVIARYFTVRTEYFLGVRDSEVFESANVADAALYIIVGTKQSSA